jgi:hypothetical protein
MNSRPASDEIAALLEPIARRWTGSSPTSVITRPIWRGCSSSTGPARSTRACPGWRGRRAARRPSLATSRCQAAPCETCATTKCSRRSHWASRFRGWRPGCARGLTHRRSRPGRVLRRANPAAAGLAAQGFRCVAVDRVMSFDHRPQRTAASSAVAACAARLGDLLGRLRAVRHHLVDDVAGGSGAKADEHRGQTRSPILMRCANLPTNCVG